LLKNTSTCGLLVERTVSVYPLPEVVALAFAIESPLHAMLIWPMVVSGVPSLTKMKFLLVIGEADPVGVGVAVADPGGVAVGVGGGAALPLGVIEGEGASDTDDDAEGDGDGDGVMTGTTAPPTAWPSRHT
jgi:hypothetical protein